MNTILADGRWAGAHGIGRFATEILARLHHTDILTADVSPLSSKDGYWLPRYLFSHRDQYRVFFSPGFMPPLYSAIPFVFTLHDLIHLRGPVPASFAKKLFYNTIIKAATQRAHKIITVSTFSKQEIMAWAKLPAEKIVVVNNGISALFTSVGKKHEPGYPYFFYAGNAKPHKNLPRLLHAFAHAQLDPSVKLILTCKLTPALSALVTKLQLQPRVINSGVLSETALAEYYRGAMALLFPSLYEGFGLPVVEAMACGTPVLTSNVTSLPEVAGDAAILVNPLDDAALAFHITQLANNAALRQNLSARGLVQATRFSWEQSARQIQNVLDEVLLGSTS